MKESPQKTLHTYAESADGKYQPVMSDAIFMRLDFSNRGKNELQRNTIHKRSCDKS